MSQQALAEEAVATYEGFMSAIMTALDLALDAVVSPMRMGEALSFLQELALGVARDYVESKRVDERLAAFLLEVTAADDYDYARYFELHHGRWFHAFKARLASQLGAPRS